MELVITKAALEEPAWQRRMRLILAVGLVWAGLHYAAEPLLRPAGSTQPLVLLRDLATVPGALLAGMILVVGGYLGGILVGRQTAVDRMIVASLALAAWTTTSGTIDDWLVITHRKPGAPTGAPYWSLLPDLLLLGLVFAVLAGPLGPRRPAAAKEMPDERLVALVVAGLALLLTLFLMGPREGMTYRGQVYFAIIGAAWLAIHIPIWLGIYTPQALVAAVRWSWVTPLVLGAIGLIAAGARPALALPENYKHLDTIPAWALARPLPVEMVGVGVAALLLTLRSQARKLAGEGS